MWCSVAHVSDDTPLLRLRMSWVLVGDEATWLNACSTPLCVSEGERCVCVFLTYLCECVSMCVFLTKLCVCVCVCRGEHRAGAGEG